MRLWRYTFKLRHDNGTVRLSTVARNRATATAIILNAERAPRSAIMSIERSSLK